MPAQEHRTSPFSSPSFSDTNWITLPFKLIEIFPISPQNILTPFEAFSGNKKLYPFLKLSHSTNYWSFLILLK